MATPIYVNQSTTLVQVDTSGLLNYTVLLSSVNTPGSIITIRDTTGNASSANPININTTQDVKFLDATDNNRTNYKITQPYGFITVTPRTHLVWAILNTFAFPDVSEAANINNITASNLTVKQSYLNNAIISTALISTLSTDNVFIRGNISVGHSTIAHAGFYTCTLRTLHDMITGGTLYAGSTVSSIFANITSTLTVPYISTQNIEIYGVLRSASTISTMGPLFVGSSISTTGNLAVGGSTFIQGELKVLQNVTFQSSLSTLYSLGVGREAMFYSSLSVKDNIFTNANISTMLNVNVGGALSVMKTAFFTGQVSTQSNLTVGGALSVMSTFYTYGNTVLNSSLYVRSGVSTLSNVYIASSLSVGGSLAVYGDIFFNDRLLDLNNLSVNQDLFVNNNISTQSSIVAGQFLRVMGSTFLNGHVSTMSNVDVGGGISTMKGLAVRGVGYFQSNLVVQSTLSTLGNFMVAGYVSTLSSVTIGQNLRVQNNVFVQSSISTVGTAAFYSSLQVQGSLSVFSSIAVSCNLDVGNLLTVKNMGSQILQTSTFSVVQQSNFVMNISSSTLHYGLFSTFGAIYAGGPISTMNTLAVGSTIHTQFINIRQNLSTSGNACIGSSIFALSNIQSGASTIVNGGFYTNGQALFNDSVRIKNLVVDDTVFIGGKTTINADTNIFGTLTATLGIIVRDAPPNIVVQNQILNDTYMLSIKTSSIINYNFQSTMGPAAFYSSIQIQGHLSVFSTLAASCNADVGALLTASSIATRALQVSTMNIVQQSNFVLNISSSTLHAGLFSTSGEIFSGRLISTTSSLAVGDNVNFYRNLTVGGNTITNGIFQAGGATTLSNILNVAQAATLSNTLNVGQAATLSNTLNVGQAATLSNTLNVGQAATLSNTLRVGQAATLSNTLNVIQGTTLTGNVGIGASSNATNALYVTGTTQFNGNVGIKGDADTYALTVNGSVFTSNVLAISTTIQSNLYVPTIYNSSLRTSSILTSSITAVNITASNLQTVSSLVQTLYVPYIYNSSLQTSSIMASSITAVNISGNLSGNGSLLTDLNATNITTGSIDSARLPTSFITQSLIIKYNQNMPILEANSVIEPYIIGTGDSRTIFITNTPPSINSTFYGITLGLDGTTLYACDYGYNTIYKITKDAVITIYAGIPSLNGGYVDSSGDSAKFARPMSGTFDPSGNLYICDYGNNAIRKIDVSRNVTTFASSAGVTGVFAPTGITYYNNSLYVCQDNGSILRITISPIAVTKIKADNTFILPTTIYYAPDGIFYIADSHAISKMTTSGTISILAGSTSSGMVNASGTNARFNLPRGIYQDNQANLYVGDTNNLYIRKVTPGGNVSIFCSIADLVRGVVIDNVGNVFFTSVSIIYKVSSSSVPKPQRVIIPILQTSTILASTLTTDIINANFIYKDGAPYQPPPTTGPVTIINLTTSTLSVGISVSPTLVIVGQNLTTSMLYTGTSPTNMTQNTTVPGPPMALNATYYTGTSWYMGGKVIANKAALYSSPTAATWSLITPLGTFPTSPASSVNAIVFNGSYYLICCYDTSATAATAASLSILKSTDMITFTSSSTTTGTLAFTAVANAAAWNGTLWVAVGSDIQGATYKGPSIKYSYDGYNWYSTINAFGAYTSLTTSVGYTVVWNGVVFVAGGKDTTCTLKYSTDGIVWYNCKGTYGSSNIKVIVWSGKRFVAVQTITTAGFNIFYSDDGITWTTAQQSITYGSSLVWTGSQFILGTSKISTTVATMYVSTDGVYWTLQGPTVAYDTNLVMNSLGYSSNTVPDMKIANTNFFSKQPQTLYTVSTTNTVLSMSNALLLNSLYSETSGKVGINCNSPQVALDINGFAKFNNTLTPNTWISMGYDTGAINSYMNVSVNNGSTWTQVLEIADSFSKALCWDGNRWLVMYCNRVVGSSPVTYLGGVVSTSPTGSAWTPVPNVTGLGAFTSFKQLIWTGTYYIVGGIGTSGNIARSLDGITWTTILGFFTSVYGIAYNGYMLVATGDDTTLTAKIKYSLNQGATWTNCISPSIANTKFGNRVATNGKVWVVGYDGGILYSLDGKTFISAINATFSATCFDIVWNGTLFVAVGQGGTAPIKYSYDGITWATSAGVFVYNAQFKAVCWNGSVFITGFGTTNGTYYSSNDGIVWTEIVSTNPSIIGPRTIMFSSNVVPDFQVENLGIYGKGQPPITTSTNTIALGPSTMVLNNTMTVSKSGFVGVNCNAPKVELDVNGTLNVYGTTTLTVPSSQVTTFVISSSTTGQGTVAALFGPNAIASTPDGTIYIADYVGNKILKVTPTGLVTTFAGTGVAGFNNGAGNLATFNGPSGIAVAPDGTVYVSELVNKCIRGITTTGVVSTYVVTQDAQDPWNVVIDSFGNLFYSSTETRQIMKVAVTSRVVTVWAGVSSTSSTRDLVDGPGTSAKFLQSSGLAIDSANNIYVADLYAVRLINTLAVVSTIAGYKTSAYSSDGIGRTASFQSAVCLYCDLKGNLYVSDENSIRKIVISTKVVTTVTGSTTRGFTNGVLSSARFSRARGITMDPTGNLFVCDFDNMSIRKIGLAPTPLPLLTTNNIIGSIPGGELNRILYVGVGGLIDPSTPFIQPNGVLLGPDGKLYIFEVDDTSNRIRTIDASGNIVLYAGEGGAWNNSTDGTLNGTLTGDKLLVNFNKPFNGTFDPSGNLYVCDTYNHIIRRIDGIAGSVTTIAGTVGINGNGNGYVNATGTSAKFYYPQYIAYYNGDLYVADKGNHAFRKIKLSDNSVTTFAGALPDVNGAGTAGYVDGLGTDARFTNTSSIYFSSMDGCFYIVDGTRILKMTTYGLVTTIVDGFSFAYGIVQDFIGNLYICDVLNSTVNKITLSGYVSVVISGVNGPYGIAIDSYGNLFVSTSQSNRIIKVAGVPYSDLSVNIQANSITANNVGIGTTTPTTMLNVNRSVRYADMISGNLYGRLQLELSSGSSRLYLGNSYTPGAGTASIIQSADYFFLTDNPSNLYLNPLGGNVGIGTTAPVCALDVTGTIRSYRNGTSSPVNTQSGDGFDNLVLRSLLPISLPNVTPRAKTSIIFAASNTDAFFARIYGYDTTIETGTWQGSLSFQTSYNGAMNDRITINGVGDVGIGVTNPNSRLHVDTDIYCGRNASFAGNGAGTVKVGPDDNPIAALRVNGSADIVNTLTVPTSGNGAFIKIDNNDRTGYVTGSIPSIAYASKHYTKFTHVTGNASGYMIADYGFLGDTWNLTYNAHTDNQAWVVPNSGIGTSRIQLWGGNIAFFVSLEAIRAPTTQIMTITKDGLELTGSINVTGTRTVSYSSGYFFSQFIPNLAFTNPATNSVSIKAAGYVYSAVGFIAASDERIKKNIKQVTDSLDIVNSLNFVSFDYIDYMESPVKHGLIAQEVQKVYPEAICIIKDYIPSVFSLATKYENTDNKVTITSATPHGFTINDKIRLYISRDDKLDKSDICYDTDLLEVISDTQFVVKPWDNFVLDRYVFIYGKEVGDFLSIDKPLIGLIAAGACKVLSEKVTIQHSEIETLKATVAAQAAEIESLKTAVAAILQKYPVP